MRLALTKRQADVVLLIEKRRSYPQIAQELGISQSTVRTHVNMVAAKLPWQHLTPRAAVLHYLESQS
jgi:DNA-binding CsgD family transcriptional regulator